MTKTPRGDMFLQPEDPSMDRQSSLFENHTVAREEIQEAPSIRSLGWYEKIMRNLQEVPRWTRYKGYAYLLSSRNNLRLLMSQGYIGPIHNRETYDSDFIALSGGFIPLFRGPFGTNLVNYVEHGEYPAPFAMEIEISKIENGELVQALDVHGNALPWSIDMTDAAVILVPGSIPLSSVNRILTRSLTERDYLLQTVPSDRNVNYDRLKIEAAPDLFTDGQHQTDGIVEALQVFGSSDTDAIDLTPLDNYLDRITGAISALGYVAQQSSSANHMMEQFVLAVRALVNSPASDMNGVHKYIDALYYVLRSQGTSSVRRSDRYIFTWISEILLEMKPDQDPLTHRELLNAITARVEEAHWTDDALTYALNASDHVGRFFGARAPEFSAVRRTESYNSWLPLTLLLISKNLQGVLAHAKREAINPEDLAVASFWLGLLRGRRKMEIEERLPELDLFLEEWIARSLSDGKNERLQQDNSDVTVCLDKQVKLPGEYLSVTINDKTVLAQDNRVLLPELVSVFTAETLEIEEIASIAVRVCKEMGWDAIYTLEIKHDRPIDHKSEELADGSGQHEFRGHFKLKYRLDIEEFLLRLQSNDVTLSDSTIMQLVAQKTGSNDGAKDS